MANLSFRSASSNDTATATLAFSTPSGATANDVAVALMLSAALEGSGAPTVSSSPSGWTQIGSDLTFTVFALEIDVRVTAWRKILAGSDSYSWGMNTAGFGSAGLVGVWDNPNTSNPFDTHLFTAKNPATTDYGSAEITTAENNELLIHMGINFDGTSRVSSTTLTERFDDQLGPNDLGAGFICDGIQASAGASGAKAATASVSAAGVVILLALRSEADGGGGGRTTKNTRAFPLGTEIGMGWRMHHKLPKERFVMNRSRIYVPERYAA